MRDGRMANAQLTNYIIPTPLDTPPIDTVILEQPYKHGPLRRQGCRRDADRRARAAVVNALRHAGFDVRAIPATPERLMTAARLKPSAAAGPGQQPHDDRLTINGAARRLDVHPMKRVARCAARGLRLDRHQGRLRRGRVRRVHGPHRRAAGQLVSRARRASRRRHVLTIEGSRRTARCIRCRTRLSPRAAHSAASARPA